MYFVHRFGDSGQLENVVLKLELMDKSTKFLKYYQGQLSLKSTAYPHISSITSLKFRVSFVYSASLSA